MNDVVQLLLLLLLLVIISYYYYYYYYYYYCFYYSRRKQITRGRYNTKYFLAHTPAGAESDLNAAAAAPSQTEVTDLNCSDHSTTSKEMAA